MTHRFSRVKRLESSVQFPIVIEDEYIDLTSIDYDNDSDDSGAAGNSAAFVQVKPGKSLMEKKLMEGTNDNFLGTDSLRDVQMMQLDVMPDGEKFDDCFQSGPLVRDNNEKSIVDHMVGVLRSPNGTTEAMQEHGQATRRKKIKTPGGAMYQKAMRFIAGSRKKSHGVINSNPVISCGSELSNTSSCGGDRIYRKAVLARVEKIATMTKSKTRNLSPIRIDGEGGGSNRVHPSSDRDSLEVLLNNLDREGPERSLETETVQAVLSEGMIEGVRRGRCRLEGSFDSNTVAEEDAARNQAHPTPIQSDVLSRHHTTSIIRQEHFESRPEVSLDAPTGQVARKKSRSKQPSQSNQDRNCFSTETEQRFVKPLRRSISPVRTRSPDGAMKVGPKVSPQNRESSAIEAGQAYRDIQPACTRGELLQRDYGSIAKRYQNPVEATQEMTAKIGGSRRNQDFFSMFDDTTEVSEVRSCDNFSTLSNHHNDSFPIVSPKSSEAFFSFELNGISSDRNLQKQILKEQPRSSLRISPNRSLRDRHEPVEGEERDETRQDDPDGRVEPGQPIDIIKIKPSDEHYLAEVIDVSGFSDERRFRRLVTVAEPHSRQQESRSRSPTGKGLRSMDSVSNKLINPKRSALKSSFSRSQSPLKRSVTLNLQGEESLSKTSLVTSSASQKQEQPKNKDLLEVDERVISYSGARREGTQFHGKDFRRSHSSSSQNNTSIEPSECAPTFDKFVSKPNADNETVRRKFLKSDYSQDCAKRVANNTSSSVSNLYNADEKREKANALCESAPQLYAQYENESHCGPLGQSEPREDPHGEDSVGDDYTTDNTNGSGSEETDSKISNQSLFESEDSDLDDLDVELYDSFAVPFLVRMLDKSFAWLEKSNDQFPCGGGSHSLLKETRKGPEDSKMSVVQPLFGVQEGFSQHNCTDNQNDVTYRSARPSPLTARIYKSPALNTFLKQEELVKSTKSLTPKISNTTTMRAGPANGQIALTETPQEAYIGRGYTASARDILESNHIYADQPQRKIEFHVGAGAGGQKKIDASECTELSTQCSTKTAVDKSTHASGRSKAKTFAERKAQIVAERNALRAVAIATMRQAEKGANSYSEARNGEKKSAVIKCPTSGVVSRSKPADHPLDPGSVNLPVRSTHMENAKKSRPISPEKQRGSDKSDTEKGECSSRPSYFQEKLKARLAHVRGLDTPELELPAESRNTLESTRFSRDPEDEVPKSQKSDIPIGNVRPDDYRSEKAASLSSAGSNRHRSFAGGPESMVSNSSRSRKSPPGSPQKRLSQKVNFFLKTIREDIAIGGENQNDFYASLTEDERLAALELAEKLRRRAATLKRRRKVRERRNPEATPHLPEMTSSNAL